MRLLLLCFAFSALALPLHAAESDPYWAWRAPPKDATQVLDRILNRKLALGLAQLNKTSTTSCREAVRVLVGPLRVTSDHFFRSEMRRWPMDRSPKTFEHRDEFDAHSVYRDAPLLPFGSLVPLDPSLLVDDVVLGPDKIGHFFTNGLRAWETSLDARSADDKDGYVAAMRYGVDEENGWLGKGIDGVFSWADLTAAAAGVRFYASLCDAEQPVLVRGGDGRWSLSRLFALEDWVDPCWDESFNPSAFTDAEDTAVKEGVAREACPLLDDAAVQARRARYRARGCHARTQQVFHDLIVEGVAPDPAPWNVESVCRNSRPPAAVAARR